MDGAEPAVFFLVYVAVDWHVLKKGLGSWARPNPSPSYRPFGRIILPYQDSLSTSTWGSLRTPEADSREGIRDGKLAHKESLENFPACINNCECQHLSQKCS